MNHYETLKVNKNATKEEITLAHKRLAMRLHPDRNPSKEAAEEFKKVNKAYSILNNPTQKAAYDKEIEQKEFYRQAEKNKANNSTSSSSSSNSNTQNNTQPTNNSNYHTQRQTYNHTQSKEDRTETDDRLRVKKDPKEIPIILGFWEAVKGGKYLFEFLYNNTLYKTELDIIPGVENGQRFIVMAENIIFDLILQIEEDKNYHRRGIELYATFDIPFNIAILGGTVIYESFNGDITIDIKPNLKNGEKIVIKNRGVLTPEGLNGDLTLTANIVLPKNLTDRQIELLKEFMIIENKKEKGLYFFKTAPFWEAIRKKFITV